MRSLAPGLLLLALLSGGVLAAQDLDYREHLQLAERFERLGEYLPAAEQYAGAYRARPKKHEYAFAAAERFSLVKDYARAAEHYAAVAREWRDYPLAGLRYARSLKQAGRYDEAIAAYKDYLSYYRGDDGAIIRKLVEDEVRGATMAQEALAAGGADELVVEALGPQINGPDDETAPMPLSREVLYFLSDRRGLMRMFRTVRTGEDYAAAEAAAQFPIVPGQHVGSGSLGPEGDRFYFGLCDGREVATQPTARCTLYVIARADGGWGAPEALPAYINAPGTSTAHPFAYRDGDREVLLFASDRLEGHGGMDLYRAERQLGSGATDFTFPDNLGARVNGSGNDVSPYYDPAARTLYFASDGYVNMGGFDVFRARGGEGAWSPPENLGAPVNGPADDYFYRAIPGTRLATLASNRAVGGEKTRTSNEDLYLVRPGRPTAEVGFQVADAATGRGLDDVTLAGFLRDGDGPERLVASARTDDGFFALDLPAGATVELRLQRPGYEPATATVEVPARQRDGFQAPRIEMHRVVVTLADVQEIEEARTSAPVASLPTASAVDRPSPGPTRPQASAPVTAPAPAPTSMAPTSMAPTSMAATSIAAPTEAADRSLENPRIPAAGGTPTATAPPVVRSPEPVASGPVPGPVPGATPAREYRIQIEARDAFEPEHRRYATVRTLGALSSNYVTGRNLYRVLVGTYTSVAEAKAALAEVRRAGWRDAFVAGFEDGRYRGATGG